jgi:hypothetical protein
MNKHTAVSIIQKLISSDIYGAIDTILSSVTNEAKPVSGGIVLPDIFVETCINKLRFIKVVMSVTGWGLAESHDVYQNRIFTGSASQWFEICRRQSEWVAVPPKNLTEG